MSEYKVIKIDDCPRCYGNGYVVHSAWKRYFEAFPRRTLPTMEDDLKWFQEQGFSYNKVSDLPPEEIPCPLCKTSGRVRSEVDLRTALTDVEVWRLIGGPSQ